MPPETLPRASALCAGNGLTLLGGFHPLPDDKAPEACKTLLMVGPDVGFWEGFRASPEYSDEEADPLDRWSLRVLGGIARELGAEPVFPFGGPPYAPFISWALRSAQCFVSPVGLLVHAEHGLMVSFRGALAFSERLALPEPSHNPCETCVEKPCLSACPAGVLTTKGYDVPGCHAYLRTASGQDCKSSGCMVRRACPLNGADRKPDQSGFHMTAFQGE